MPASNRGSQVSNDRMTRLGYLLAYLCLSIIALLSLASQTAAAGAPPAGAPPAGVVNFSGYIKSYNIWQQAIDIPLIQSDMLTQSQNSIRLNFEGFGQTFGFDSVWQLHYEASPLLSSSALTLNNTFASSTGAYRLSDIQPTIGAATPKRRVQQNLDRLNLQFNFDSADLTIGRQAISFGAARFINPTDVFLPFDIRTFNTEYRTGIDAIRFQKPVGQLGEIDLGIILGPDGNPDSSALFGQLKTNLSGHDIHATLIRFAEQNLIGFGVQSALWNFGTWFEAASVTGVQDYWRLSLGFDYSLTESTLASVEYHYNGAGSDDPASYLSQFDQAPYTLGGVFLLGENYLIPAVSVQISPLLTLGLQGVFNLDDRSTYTSAIINYNIQEDLYLGLGIYHFSGKEFSQSRLGVPTLNSEYGSNPDNLFLSINYYF